MRRAGVLVLAIVATLLVPLSAPSGAVPDSGAETHFVQLVNRERTAHGLGPLGLRADVADVARRWTAAMIDRGGLAHNPALRDVMPADWLRIGENVGRGPGVDELHRAFMASDSHRANVLGDFTDVGVGAAWADGVLWVTFDFIKSAAGPSSCAATPAVSAAGAGVTDASTNGYYVLGSDGGVFAFGDAPYVGSLPERVVRSEAVSLVVKRTSPGYWILGPDGGVFTFGDAEFHGSVPGLGLPSPVRSVDLALTPTGDGYWILGQDGGVFAFGDAVYLGGLPELGVRAAVVRLVPTPTGRGYWLVTSDGGVFTFGDAVFLGSVPALGLRTAAISMAVTPSGRGYWVLGRDGGVFTFGDAPFRGSVSGDGVCHMVGAVELSPTVSGNGYYVLGDRGEVFAFGDARGFGDAVAVTASARGLVAGAF